jgi:hypothetical protein
MSIQHESINVRVSKRILWFGSEAYPLHNITRTNTLKLVPKRGVAIKRYLLVEFLNLTRHELVIETAAGSHRGLVSNSRNVVHDLAFRITDAINNPLAEFQMRVENFQVGDNVTMFGDHNIGKAVR